MLDKYIRALNENEKTAPFVLNPTKEVEEGAKIIRDIAVLKAINTKIEEKKLNFYGDEKIDEMKETDIKNIDKQNDYDNEEEQNKNYIVENLLKYTYQDKVLNKSNDYIGFFDSFYWRGSELKKRQKRLNTLQQALTKAENKLKNIRIIRINNTVIRFDSVLNEIESKEESKDLIKE